jgi:heavy metal sensor kinase
MSLRIRARLTLWYVGVLASVLVAFSAGVLWLQNHYSRAQFDTELASVATATASILRSELEETHQLQRAAHETRNAVDIPNRTVAILDAGGRPVAAHWRGFPRERLPQLVGSSPLTATLDQGLQRWRIRLVRERSADGPFLVFVAAAEGPIAREQRVLARTLLMAMPAAVLLSALVCWWAASRALAPLTQMSDEAERVTMQSLDTGLSEGQSDDEIGQLGRAFNRLLRRVSTAVNGQRQFMADASHELRTPVAAARAAADVTLAQPHRNEEEYRDALYVVRSQTERLGRMVDDMLVLARADAGGYRLRPARCFADEILLEPAEAAAALAAAKGIDFELSLEPSLPLAVDEVLIQQMTLNLLTNAVLYTASGGRVRLELRRADAVVEVRVRDTGCGIPLAERARVFDRFVRLDEARESAGGAGLGLPIARWIAECHGGMLILADSGPHGSTFVARLPLAFEDSDAIGESSTPSVDAPLAASSTVAAFEGQTAPISVPHAT